jgi:acyl carrier protein
MNVTLVSVLSDVFGLPADQIVPELTKDDVGSWDSLKQMDLVMSIEKKFGITLEVTDIIKMNSVVNIMEVLKDKGVELGT